jgi:hypothetical protein
VRGVAAEPVTSPTASGWVAGPGPSVGCGFSRVGRVSEVERMTPRPLIDTTFFLAFSPFATPPSVLWSVKTQSVQVPFSVVHGSGGS